MVDDWLMHKASGVTPPHQHAHFKWDKHEEPFWLQSPPWVAAASVTTTLLASCYVNN